MWKRFVNLWTRSFHEWRMTCQSQDQSMPGGGPTIARSNFRKAMSIWYWSPWWSVRCPAPNRATGETVASKNRNRSFKRAEWSQRICLWEKNVLEAACRWCVTSNFVRPLFPMQKIHPNHLCPDKPALTCKSFCRSVCKKLGGWASLVKSTVLFKLRNNPTSSRSSSRASNNSKHSTEVEPNMKISSANLKSNNRGIPSCISMPKPLPSTLERHLRMAHCKTPVKSLGLRTHPCRTPPLIENSSLMSSSPLTQPRWLKYKHCMIHTMCSETPWSKSAAHNLFQSTRSKAFDKSKLMTHTGMSIPKNLSTTKFAVTRCSSKRRLGRNPCCSSGWPASIKGSIRASNM